MNGNTIKPSALARMIKESAVTVSLRVKESTQDGFASIAKLYDLSPNAMMAKLVDLYIENLKDCLKYLDDEKLDKDAKKYILRLYEQADMLSHMSEEEALRAYLGDICSVKLGDGNALEAFRDMIDRENRIYSINLFMKNNSHVMVIPTLEEKCSFESSEDKDLHAVSLKVPYKKWAIIAILFIPVIRESMTNESRHDASIFNDVEQIINRGGNNEQIVKSIADLLVSDTVTNASKAN